jgi:hypothetical protein
MYGPPALITLGSLGAAGCCSRLVREAAGWIFTEGNTPVGVWGLHSLFAVLDPVTEDPERIMGRPGRVVALMALHV